MIRRGLNSRGLALRAGTSHRRIENVLALNDKSWPIRASINRALQKRIFQGPPKRKSHVKNTRLL
jgi:hypothetical protein